jgi:DNA-binding transcriptional MerR regulator/methylmalonyl-CoA mutase cobalamin-binding subunit
MILPSFNIAAVERDTGLSKDVLRVWERRYGFPSPDRDGNGERTYPADQVERLRLIKRLMDHGHRPGKLIDKPTEELLSLAPRRPAAQHESETSEANDLAELLALIKQHDAGGYQRAMQQRLARRGLHKFIADTIAPLTRMVGDAWEDGSFEVFEEHLFAEQTKRLLRQAIAALPGPAPAPRILLTTVPDELHVLGLLMAEALFSLEGADCIALGTQMPLLEIGRASTAHRADIVALSFSAGFPPRQIPGLLQQLRLILPPAVALWVGGSGIARLAEMDGILLLGGLDDALTALAEWRAKHSTVQETA